MSFFDSMVGMTPQEALEACEAEHRRLGESIAAVEAERANLPRSDRAGANALLAVIRDAQAMRARVKALSKIYRVKAESQEEHGMWRLAVRVVAGDEALGQCIEWMKAERKRRRQVKADAP